MDHRPGGLGRCRWHCIIRNTGASPRTPGFWRILRAPLMLEGRRVSTLGNCPMRPVAPCPRWGSKLTIQPLRRLTQALVGTNLWKDRTRAGDGDAVVVVP